MKDSSSPEDKLLKLIRNPKKPADSGALKADSAKVKSGPFFNLRRVFFWLFIASGIYLIANLIYPWVGLKNIRLPKPSDKLPQESPGAKSAARPLEEYLESVKGRQIFSQAAAMQDDSLINAANTDLMKDISLVGIISGENPQAVIEDKKAQKTYYVTKGKFIGEMQVEDIQEGKIIINYGGQKYELYM
jgi:hypothetical protein